MIALASAISASFHPTRIRYSFYLAERVSDDWHLQQGAGYTPRAGDPDPKFPVTLPPNSPRI